MHEKDSNSHGHQRNRLALHHHRGQTIAAAIAAEKKTSVRKLVYQYNGFQGGYTSTVNRY